MSDSPRTDAAMGSDSWSGVSVTFARQLERGLYAAQATLGALIEHTKQADARAEKFKNIADDVLRANPLIVDQRATAEAVRRAEQAEAKLAEYKEDAERYRWLRKHANKISACRHDEFMWGWSVDQYGKDDPTLDAAIDAAQQKAKEEK